MSIYFYIFITIVLFLALILLLSFIGPENKKSGFWNVIQTIRKWMDAAGYWFFNACAVGTILLVLVYAAMNFTGCSTSALQSEAEKAASSIADESGETVSEAEITAVDKTTEVETTKVETEKNDKSRASDEESLASDESSMEETMDESFYITEITDDIWQRINGKSFKEDCTLPLEDLRYLHVLHVDAEGVEHEGEMICNVHIADTVLDILRQLYEAGYPIEKIRLVDEYDAVDEASMRDNNSSSFNFRFISHTTTVSKHGLGLAVDINTLYNPYIKYVNNEQVLEPATAEPYLDREAEFPYKIERGDLCYRLFTENGFEWGGDWTNSKDYQHFELPTEEVKKLYP